MTKERTASLTLSHVTDFWRDSTRREFMRVACLGGTAVLLPSILAGCSDDDGGGGITDPPSNALIIDLNTDVGVLNYAYALEQLEAAFYSQVVQGFASSGLSAAEQTVLSDIRNHEVIHRDFLALVLVGAKIPDLAVDFSSVDFSDRVSILRTAKAFEDVGVSAYNGAGRLLKDLNNLAVAGKIVSVEARHAAAIRDLLRPGTRDFAGDDVIDPASGLDIANEPGQVLEGTELFFTTPIRLVT